VGMAVVGLCGFSSFCGLCSCVCALLVDL